MSITHPADPSDPRVIAFCARVAPGVTPVSLTPAPFPGAQLHNCFIEVEHAVRREGGVSVCGWCVTEWTNVLIEGEFHGVWQRPDGVLQDVTPLPPEMHAAKHRLFLRDDSRTYDGRQVMNIRVPAGPHPAIPALIKAMEAQFEVQNRGARAFQHGVVKIPPWEMAPILEKSQAAMLELIRDGVIDPTELLALGR